MLLADDVDYYRRCREVFIKPPEMPQRYNTPVKWGCPYDCGLCTDHEQHSCLSLIEVSDFCNLRCPICYASSGPERKAHRSLEVIERMPSSREMAPRLRGSANTGTMGNAMTMLTLRRLPRRDAAFQRQLHTQIAARHHDAIGQLQDFIQVIQRLGLLNLRDNRNPFAALIEESLQANHVSRAANER